MATGAESAELTFTPLIHDRFRQDAARRITSAKKQQVVGPIAHLFLRPPD
jgi:hypothetical protein